MLQRFPHGHPSPHGACLLCRDPGACRCLLFSIYLLLCGFAHCGLFCTLPRMLVYHATVRSISNQQQPTANPIQITNALPNLKSHSGMLRHAALGTAHGQRAWILSADSWLLTSPKPLTMRCDWCCLCYHASIVAFERS